MTGCCRNIDIRLKRGVTKGHGVIVRLLTHVRGQTMRNAYDDRCEKRRGVPALSGTPVNPRARRYKMAMTAMFVTANKEWKTKGSYLREK